MKPSPRVVAVLCLAAVTQALLTGVYAELPPEAAVEGVAFLVAGLSAWVRRPENNIGRILVAYPYLAWAGQLHHTNVPLLWTLSQPLSYATSFGILIYTMFAFPRGRLGGWIERSLFGLLIGNFLWQLAITRFFDPSQTGCAPFSPRPNCPPGLNLFVVRHDLDVVSWMARLNPWWLAVVMAGTALVLVARWMRASRALRRVLGPVLIPALAILLANRIAGLAQVFLQPDVLAEDPALLQTLSSVEQAAIFLLPFSMLVGLIQSRFRHAYVSRLVVELGDLPPPEHLEHSLQMALGDPSLQVGIWDGSRRTFVGADGHEVLAPDPASGLSATTLERHGRPLALVVYDSALLDEPGLMEATVAAVRLAVENESLHARLRAQLEEVRASRARIIEASDEARKRIERDLHDGAQQRLVALAMKLRMALRRAQRSKDGELARLLEESVASLEEALHELRELSRGLHPAVLSESGLPDALDELAERSSVPVRLEVPDARFPASVEAAAYFVTAETLTNVARYSAAKSVSVGVKERDGVIEVTVQDDGVGGADPDRGSGLRGLSDRVAAIGGELWVESPPGKGTSVVARIPCEWSSPMTRS